MSGFAYRLSPLFWPRFFSGKWCKDKCYFLNHQNFSKKFFRKFSEPFCLSLLIEAGAKVSLFSESPKDFGTFFKIFQNLYNRANEMCTFYKRNVQKKDFFSRQTKSVQSVFEQRLNSRLETQNQTLFSWKINSVTICSLRYFSYLCFGELYVIRQLVYTAWCPYIWSCGLSTR